MTTTTIIDLGERLEERAALPPSAGRVPLAERVAMRVGVALILWSHDRAGREVGATVLPHPEVDAFRVATTRGLPIH